MNIREDILQRLGREKRAAVPVHDEAHLYSELAIDSLSFIGLLLEIEEAYSIEFSLMEMGDCVKAKRLIALIEEKIKEKGRDDRDTNFR